MLAAIKEAIKVLIPKRGNSEQRPIAKLYYTKETLCPKKWDQMAKVSAKAIKLYGRGHFS